MTKTLYHFTNKNIKGRLNPSYFGDNLWTSRDKIASTCDRLFFYTQDRPVEKFFKGCLYCYIVKVSENNIYDITQDRDNLLNQSKNNGNDSINIDRLLTLIKLAGYKGILYNIGYDIVCLFDDIGYDKKIERRT